MKTFKLLFLSTLLILTACQKDQGMMSEDPMMSNPGGNGELVSSKLTGQVVGPNGSPIVEAIVKFQQLETITNDDGFFVFEKMDLSANGQALSVEKSGYFKNYKKIIPHENKTYQEIGLIIKNDPTGSFIASDGGTIAKLDGERISFQPNSIARENGEIYQGEVTVFSHHFDPEKPYFNETMPGDLSAINLSGEPVQLATYSMILVELFGEGGEALNLIENRTATVEFPLKAAAASAAPETIPLWYLDENTGTWVEESSATKQGDFYVGEVAHFSFWNCDAPFDLVQLTGTVVDLNGNPIQSIRVSIEMVSGVSTRSSTTDVNGVFSGKIPKNESLLLHLKNACDEIFFTQNIGPFSMDEEITIMVELSTTGNLLVTGSLKACNGEPIEAGYVVLKRNTQETNQIIQVDDLGNFSHYTNNCNLLNLTIYGVNESNFTKTPEVEVVFMGQTSEDVGELTAYDIFADFFRVRRDGIEIISYSYALTTLREGRFSTIADPSFEPLDDAALIEIIDPMEGLNIPCGVLVNKVNESFLLCNEIPGNNPCVGNFTIDISRYDNFVNGYVIGTAIGELYEAGSLVPVEIDFQVKVDQVVDAFTGTIWDDLNQNGIRESNEPGIPNVELSYSIPHFPGVNYQFNTITDSDGNYEVDMSVGPRFSTLQIKGFPVGYVSTLQNQGTNEALDSDFQQGLSEININLDDFPETNTLDLGIHL